MAFLVSWVGLWECGLVKGCSIFDLDGWDCAGSVIVMVIRFVRCTEGILLVFDGWIGVLRRVNDCSSVCWILIW